MEEEKKLQDQCNKLKVSVYTFETKMFFFNFELTSGRNRSHCKRNRKLFSQTSNIAGFSRLQAEMG